MHEMLVFNQFLQTVIEATKLSPLTCGQPFIFNNKLRKFVLQLQKYSRTVSILRSVLFQIIFATLLIRILNLRHQNLSTTVEKNLCIMVSVAYLYTSEYNRIINESSVNFVQFFNDAINIETNLVRGKNNRKIF